MDGLVALQCLVRKGYKIKNEIAHGGSGQAGRLLVPSRIAATADLSRASRLHLRHGYGQRFDIRKLIANWCKERAPPSYTSRFPTLYDSILHFINPPVVFNADFNLCFRIQVFAIECLEKKILEYS